MKKVLVTGGAGFIGSHIVDRLLEEGSHVIVVDNESTDSHETFNWNNDAENYLVDINDYETLNPLMKDVDEVFHLAAEARIQPAIQNPILAVTTNVVGTCNVLQSARENSVKRVVYSSTSSAYGFNDIPSVETMKKDCLNPYSGSKTAGEELCQMYYNLFGLETVTFRYFNVYGERQPTRGQYAPVIGLFQRQVNDSEPMTIVGDGMQRRDFTHVSDVVEANIKAMRTENKDALGEIFNIGTETNYNIHDLVEMLTPHDPVEGVDYVHIPERVGEVKESLSDCTKAKKLLEWEAKIKLGDWVHA
mgnify:FL=1